MYLLIQLNITSLELEPTPGKDSCKLRKCCSITSSRFVLNGFILLYQGILNNFNFDTMYEITIERIGQYLLCT